MVGLYPLIHPGDVARSRPAVDDLLSARVPWLQLRGGTPRQLMVAADALRPEADRAGITLIINDRADVAAMVRTGVHVGQDDLPPSACRMLLGPGRTIGFSTHDEAEAAAALKNDDVGYLAIGPVYPTGTKADARPVVGIERLRAIVETVRGIRPDCPVVAIGGIDAGRAGAVLDTGVAAVAVIAALRDASGALDRSRIAEMIAACRRAA